MIPNHKQQQQQQQEFWASNPMWSAAPPGSFGPMMAMPWPNESQQAMMFNTRNLNHRSMHELHLAGANSGGFLQGFAIPPPGSENQKSGKTNKKNASMNKVKANRRNNSRPHSRSSRTSSRLR